jgi:hypothetical protein
VEKIGIIIVSGLFDIIKFEKKITLQEIALHEVQKHKRSLEMGWLLS